MLALLAVTALLAGADDPFEGMQNPKRLLQGARLTEVQLDQLRAIRKSEAARQRELEARVEVLGRQVEEEIASDAPNDTTLIQHANELLQLQTELEKLKLSLLVRMRSVLTPEQRARVAATFQKRRALENQLRELPPAVDR